MTKREVSKSAALFLLAKIDQIRAQESERLKLRGGRYVLGDGELSAEGQLELGNCTLCYLTGTLQFFAGQE
jgi:hypothetical protein